MRHTNKIFNKMKQNLKLAVLIISVACFFASCGNSKKDALTQKWQCSEFSSPSMDEQMNQAKASLDTITDSLTRAMTKSMLDISFQAVDEMKKAMKSTTMEFKKDGKYETHMTIMGKDKSEQGSWTLSEDGKTLVMIDPKGK